MAGEVEELFTLNFQGDSLHSGSISFGRFENESLSWERRSSFSHNRYLEEVEKYSKPGSVTEKKAYFEAHFKKKALQSQSSSDCQNGNEYPTSETEFSENVADSDEYDHVNEASHFAHFDHSPDGSASDGEFVVIECESVNMEIPYSETHVEPAVKNVDIVGSSVPEHVKPRETHQSEAGEFLVCSAEPELAVKIDGNEAVVNVDLTSKAVDMSPNSQTIGKKDCASSELEQEPSAKVTAASEMKCTKPRLTSQVNVTKAQRSESSEASNDSSKKPSRREREGSLRTKTEKQSSHAAAPNTHSTPQTSKPEDSGTSSARGNRENKSEKDLRAKKVETQYSASERLFPKTSLTSNRPKKNMDSTKPDLKQSTASLRFRSDERAEKRKEFYMKLEEKIHAKEAEMNQIQAKTQEKTEAEIKQFRRSLNFKATPMPAFYHESIKPRSDKNKVVSSNTKTIKPKSKSPSPGVGTAARSSCNTQEGKALSSSYPLNTSDPPQMDSEVTRKKEEDKVKDMNLQKHRTSDSKKVIKGRKVEEKQKARAGKLSNEIVKKDINGNSSGMSHLAIGVAS